MESGKRTGLWVVMILAMFDASAFAQGSTTTATLTGVIQDSSGGVVPGVTVVVRNIRTGVTNEAISNSTGTFSVPALDPGEYEATASLTGFKTVKVDRIGLQPGNTSSTHPAQLDGDGPPRQRDLDHDRRGQRPGPGRPLR